MRTDIRSGVLIGTPLSRQHLGSRKKKMSSRPACKYVKNKTVKMGKRKHNTMLATSYNSDQDMLTKLWLTKNIHINIYITLHHYIIISILGLKNYSSSFFFFFFQFCFLRHSFSVHPWLCWY